MTGQAVDIARCLRVPDHEEIAGLLRRYYEIIAARFAAIGGPELDVARMVADSLDGLQSYLPPDGALLLGRDRAGRLLGCGFLRRLDAERVEMKRVFVHPETQGTGLGRRMTEALIATARDEMGARELCADTVRGNAAMLALYDRLGFEVVERYPGNGNPDALDRFLVYRRIRL